MTKFKYSRLRIGDGMAVMAPELSSTAIIRIEYSRSGLWEPQSPIEILARYPDFDHARAEAEAGLLRLVAHEKVEEDRRLEAMALVDAFIEENPYHE